MANDINTKAPGTAHVALLLNFQLHMWLANHRQENTIVHVESRGQLTEKKPNQLHAYIPRAEDMHVNLASDDGG